MDMLDWAAEMGMSAEEITQELVRNLIAVALVEVAENDIPLDKVIFTDTNVEGTFTLSFSHKKAE